MEFVSPIRDVQLIKEIKQILKEHSSRDYVLFVLGINTGLKVSTLLSLKIDQLVDESGQVRRFLDVEDLSVYINDQVKEALNYHMEKKKPDRQSYLFASPKTDGPITRQQAYRVINEVGKRVGIQDPIGTHTLRKTFGYHAYTQGIAISLIQKRFHHHSSAETKKYIAIDHHPQKIDVNL